jgi:hypothetical protein
MIKNRMLVTLLLAAAGAVAVVAVQARADQSKSGSSVTLTPHDLKWMGTPPGLPSGAQLAVLEGDPTKSGYYTIRLKMPGSYTIAPHWHSQDEHITVISGTFHAGMGDTLNRASASTLPAGSYLSLSGHMNHFAWSKGAAVVQISGQGPFDINYVNPEDDPRRQGQGSQGSQGGN